MGRVKGTILIPIVKTMRADRQRAEKLLPEHLRVYLVERVLPSSWYPAPHHIELACALTHLIPFGTEPFVAMGRLSAQNDLQGIYRAHLFAGDPQRTLKSTSSLWRTYCDNGELLATLESANSAIVELRNYEDSCREMCGIVGGYVQGLVIAAGGEQVELSKLSCRLERAPSCRWQVQWS